ncbi:UNVERIFIED_ORG: hypothetical protein ABIB19_003376, partial [Arthrobacter sp. UYEF10]
MKLGGLIRPAKTMRAGGTEYPLLSMTMRNGLVPQGEKFKKRVAGADLSQYKVVQNGQLVVGFPIDEAVLAFWLGPQIEVQYLCEFRVREWTQEEIHESWHAD